MHDINNLMQCSKRILRLTSKYTSRHCYLESYLKHQESLITIEINQLFKKIDNLQSTKSKLNRYAEIHKYNREPDGYFGLLKRTGMFFGRWIFAATKNIIDIAFAKGITIIIVKKNQDTNVYDKIHQQMVKLGCKRVFIPDRIQKKCDHEIQRMYVFKEDIHFQEYHTCRICKKDHLLSHCPQSVCGVCGMTGHLSRSCSKNKCKICKAVGKHLTTRCPTIKCLYCGKLGHIEKRCLAKKRCKLNNKSKK